MVPADIPGTIRLADRVHPDLPESRSVFEERLALYPAGCLVLEASGRIAGYTLAHPIRYPHPPKLDTLIGAIAPDGDAFYIHDVVVAPEWRGGGRADAAIRRLLTLVKDYPKTCLVSVYGTMPFWRRHGFVEAGEALPAGTLDGYGADARWMLRVSTD